MRALLLSLLICYAAITFAQPDIKAGEYFIGTSDPGNGNGISFTVEDGAWDDLLETIVATAQTISNSSSPFLINIRLKDNSNNWGALFKKTIFFNPGVMNTRPINITYAEYFFGVFDPGEGNGTPILTFDGTFDEALETVFRANATWTMSSGPTLFNIRLKDAYNNWGPLFKKTIFPYGANPNAQLIAEGDTIKVCPNSNVTLTYNGPNGYTPTWFNGSNNNTITFTPNSAGYYSVSATLGNSSYTDSIYVAFLPAPTPTITPSGSILVCGSSSITLTTPVVANTTYQWYYNSTSINGATSANYLPTQAGSYYVVATSGTNGCKGTSPTTTLVTIASISPAGPISSCSTPVILTATTGTGNTYQWKLNGVNIPGATSSTYNATASGNYSVTVTYGSCVSTSAATSVTITSTAPTITANGPTTFCQGSSVVLTSSSSTGNTWSTGATTQSITVTSSGSYTVTVSNGNCSATSIATSVTVNSPTATPTITTSGPTTFCQGGSVTLTSSSATGNTWSNGATTQSITVMTGGSYTVNVSNGGCSATSIAATVTVNTNTTPTFNTYGPYCVGATPASLPTTSTNGITGTWSPSSISTVSAGTTTYTFTPTAGQCATTATRTVTINANTTPSFNTYGPYCVGATPGSLPTTSTNGITGTWSPSNISTANAGTSTYTFTPSAGLCATTATLTVTINANITPTFNSYGPYCVGATPGSLPTNSTNGITGTWSPSNINTANAGTSTYTFTPTAGLCATTASISVMVNTIPSTPVITPSGSTSLCPGGSVTLTSSSSTNNTWSTGALTSSIIVTTAGNYTVTVANGNCTATSSLLNVNLLSGVSIVAEPTNQTVSIGGIAQFIVSASVSPVTYQWQTNLGLGFQNLSNAGQYSGTDKDTLKVLNAALSNNNQQFRCIISSNGCSDTTNTVVLTVNNSTGINQSVTEQLFSVYPNPASGDVLIKTTRKFVGSIYTIRNLLGQILLSNKIMDETTIVRLNSLEKGVYFIQVGEDLKRTVKLIKE